MRSRFLPLLFLLGMSASLSIAQTVVPLWDGPAPEAFGGAPDDVPTLTTFLPANASAPTSAVVICPGGGYGMLAGDYEGANKARFFQQKGVAAFVLKYRLPTHGYRHPVPLLDVQRAIRLVRSHAADWKINPAKVGIMGFSAGGHLAATVDTHFDAGDPSAPDPIDRLSCRPDFALLAYPVISMKDGVTHPGSKLNLLGPNPDPALVQSLSNETQVTRKLRPQRWFMLLMMLRFPLKIADLCMPRSKRQACLPPFLNIRTAVTALGLGRIKRTLLPAGLTKPMTGSKGRASCLNRLQSAPILYSESLELIITCGGRRFVQVSDTLLNRVLNQFEVIQD